MPEQFVDDPQVRGARLWQRSGWPALLGTGLTLSLLVVIDIATISVGWVLLGTGELQSRGEFIAVLAATVGFLLFFGALTVLVWCKVLGSRSTSIRLTPTGLELDLRRGRSLAHPAPDCRETVPVADVLGVETRLESYRAFGLMANMQRAYRLTRRAKPPIFLFEERALGTDLEGQSMHDVADEIARWASVPLQDLGMVRGRGGATFAWLLAPHEWTTASLEPQQQERERLRVAFTAHGVFLVIAATILVTVLAQLF